MIRDPSSGSPSARSSSISETLESARMFLVCSARREISRIGEPSAWLATVTNEQKGSPLAGNRGGKAPRRPAPNHQRGHPGGADLTGGRLRPNRNTSLQKQ